MSQRSRVKKFENYRREIAQEQYQQQVSSKLQPFADSLHRIDQDNFAFSQTHEKMPHDDHQPLHLRGHRFDNMQEVAITETESYTADKKIKEYPSKEQQAVDSGFKVDTDSFNNYYLKGLIDEVKKYNIDHGTRSKEDTKANILASVKRRKVNHPFLTETLEATAQKLETVKSDETATAVAEEENILAEPIVSPEEDVLTKENLTDDKPNNSMSENSNEIADNISQRIQEMAQEPQVFEDDQEISLAQINHEYALKVKENEDLRQKTQQMELQIDQQAKDVMKITSKMERNDRIINIILAVLIFVFVCVAAFFIYSALRAQGII